MIFDGRKFGDEILYKVTNLVKTTGRKIKIVSILVGDDPASILYSRLKKQAASRVGIEFEVEIEKGQMTSDKLERIISDIGKRENVTGIMVQLPVPGLQGQALKEVLSAIPLNKDVDGLRWEESGVMPATVRAIIAIMEKLEISKEKRVVVVGSHGSVGRPLTHFLRNLEYGVSEIELDTPNPDEIMRWGEVIISCTGKEGIITGAMVSDGAIVIDVGSPKGEMTKEVYEKASIAVAVPNGVGPVTIACLMQNVININDE